MKSGRNIEFFLFKKRFHRLCFRFGKRFFARIARVIRTENAHFALHFFALGKRRVIIVVEVDAVRVCLPHFFDVSASERTFHNAVRRRIFLNSVNHEIHAVGIDHRHDVKHRALIKF